jgi:hypothetical protein
MSISWPKLLTNLKRHPKLVWGASLGVGGLFYLKVWLPVTKLGIPCVFHELTGLYCPGCGMTRAVLALLRLDVYQAFRYNTLLFFLLPMYVLYQLAIMKKMRRSSNVTMAVMLSATIAFGILRNLPALAWLAPTDIR